MINRKMILLLKINTTYEVVVLVPSERDMSMFLSPSPISEKFILGIGWVRLTRVALCSAELRTKQKKLCMENKSCYCTAVKQIYVNVHYV
jgi:hypothetical protein